MKQQDATLTSKIIISMQQLLLGELPEEIECSKGEDDAIRTACDNTNRLIRAFAEARPFLIALSEGCLDVDVPTRNFMVSPFKQLHANLRHLVWQTRQITQGDLNQKVDFLGEFSTSFNALIASLREKKAVEEALIKSENKYRRIFENIQDVFYVTDLIGTILDVSPSVARYSGYAREELLGKSANSFYYDPQDRMMMLDSMQKTGEVVDYEVRMKTKDNRLVIVSVNAHFLRDATGTPYGIEGSLRDITERKRAEEKIQKYSQDLEHLLAISREITSTTDLKRLYRFAVHAAKELLQLDISTLMLLSDDKTTLISGDSIGFPEILPGQFSLVEGQGLSAYVVQRKKPDIVADFSEENRFEIPEIVRKNKILSAICVPMMVEDEVFGVLIGHTREKRGFSQEDISLYQNIGNQTAIAIKNALSMEALRSGEKKLHEITSHMAEGLYVIDNQRLVTFINEEAVRLLGWSQAELNEKGIHDLVHCRKSDGTHLPADACCIDNVMITGRSYVSSDEMFVRRDGARFPVSVVVSPIMEKGRVVATVVTFKDITERKRLEQEAAKVQKLESVGILAGGIAHDFNNLLQSILGYVTLAKTPTYSEGNRSEFLSKAEQACMTATELSYRLLTFSRGGEPVKKSLSVSGLLRDIVASYISESLIRTEMLLAPNLPSVNADEGQLRQVLKNLIDNAVEAMPTGGLLRISGESISLTGEETLSLKPGSYLMIKFNDQGVGISPEHLPRIFDPYFTTKDVGSDKGMGLGLSICYSIVRKHDGMITVESEPGKGTTATIYLPVAGIQQAKAEPPVVPFSEMPSKRVLLMDDDDLVRNVAAEMLKYLNFEVVTAINGEQAVALYKQAQQAARPFDAAILDLVVPGGMGGEAAIRKLFEIDPDVRGIVSSGNSEDPLLRNFQSLGFVNAIAKPYNLEELSRVLKDSLR